MTPFPANAWRAGEAPRRIGASSSGIRESRITAVHIEAAVIRDVILGVSRAAVMRHKAIKSITWGPRAMTHCGGSATARNLGSSQPLLGANSNTNEKVRP